jgi:hypothetical protein
MLKSELSRLSLLNKISIASDADFLIVHLAEEEGFEPPDPCGSTVFKTAAIDHSAIPPLLFKSLLFPCGVFPKPSSATPPRHQVSATEALHPQSRPAIEPPQPRPAIESLQSRPAIEPPQSRPAIEPPQSRPATKSRLPKPRLRNPPSATLPPKPCFRNPTFQSGCKFR